MIPVELVLKGVYSFRERQVIRFEDLVKSGLFGIFGPVGSGKSTILEAIGFALYGDTERLNQRESRGYNMMNLRSKELLVDLTFDHKGDRFRFVVKGSRSKTDHSSVPAFKRSAMRITGGAEEILPSADATTLLGLSYENFRKTVIIPQGQFKEFLQLPDRERTVMMQEIFQLHRFDLSEKVARLQKKEETLLAGVTAQLASLSGVEEVRKVELQNRQAEGKSALDGKREGFEKLQSELRSLERLQALQETALRRKADVEVLRKERTRWETRRTELDLHAKAERLLRAPLAHLTLVERKLADREAIVTGLRDEHQVLKKNVEARRARFEGLARRFARRDEERLRLEELARYAEVRRLDDSLAKAKVDLGTLLRKEEDLIRKEEALVEALGDRKARLIEAKTLLPAVDLLHRAKTWFASVKESESRLRELDEDAADLRNRIAALDLISRAAREFAKASGEPDSDLPKLLTARKELLAEKRGRLDRLRTRDATSTLAAQLEEGVPCPLCGSAHHPSPLDPGALIGEISSLEKEIRTLETFLETLVGHLDAHRAAVLEEERLRKELEKIAARREILDSAFQELRENPTFDPALIRSAEGIEEKLRQAEEDRRSIAREEKAIAEAEVSREVLRTEISRLALATGEGRTRLASLEARRMTLEEQITRLDVTSFASGSTEELDLLVEEGIAALDRLAADHAREEALLKEIEGKSSASQVRLVSEENERNALINERTQAREEFEKRLAEAGLADRREAERVLAPEFDAIRLRAEIEAWEKALHVAEDRAKEALVALEGQAPDLHRAEEVKATLEKLGKEIEGLQQELGALRKGLERFDEEWARKISLLAEEERITKRLTRIGELASLFRGRDFVKYVSTVFLKDLVASANRRFRKLTRQSLSLELSDSLQFEVRDHLHDGLTRSVRTLSGGQTFQAALCLALALADQVGSLIREDRNFFFLDEGFGSLDPVSLSETFEALKSLRHEKRIVGVISHMEDVKQEIDRFLEVRNDPETGSRVTHHLG